MDREIEKRRFEANEWYEGALKAILEWEEDCHTVWEKVYDHCRTFHRCKKCV